MEVRRMEIYVQCKEDIFNNYRFPKAAHSPPLLDTNFYLVGSHYFTSRFLCWNKACWGGGQFHLFLSFPSSDVCVYNPSSVNSGESPLLEVFKQELGDALRCG